MLTLASQAARREDFERVRRGNLKERHKSAQERWKWIEDYSWSQGVHRSAQQCQDKWELLVSEFKKVHDYEKSLPEGQKSYWDMSKEEKKKTAMPPNFYKAVYNALVEWYSKSRPADPGELDSSGPLRHTGMDILVQMLRLDERFFIFQLCESKSLLVQLVWAEQFRVDHIYLSVMPDGHSQVRLIEVTAFRWSVTLSSPSRRIRMLRVTLNLC